MAINCLLVILVICFHLAIINGFFLKARHWSPRSLIARQALKPDAEVKVESFRIEYEELLMKYDLREAYGKDTNPDQKRLGDLNDFFESLEAIAQIDEDLKMCTLQMNSDNEDTRTKATFYFDEFSHLKEDLERELNKMLE